MILYLAQIPSMSRQELWHPMVVHLPLGLLPFGVLLYLLHFLIRTDPVRSRLLFAGRLSLAAGSLAAWPAVVTGEMADRVIGRTLCDPLVLEAHETYAYAVAFLFSVVTALDLGSIFVKNERLLAWGRTLLACAMVAGAALIGYVGHLGGKLVYQQGAAVYHPSEDCSEFRSP